MGWETAIQAGATIYSGIKQNNAARTEAKAITEEARIQAENKARETVREGGRLQSSFLSSGFTMEGTPTEVLKHAYQYGKEDINQIAKNANARSKNIMTKARAQMLEGATGMFSQINMGGTMKDLTFGTNSVDGFGQELGSLFATDAPGVSSSMGPYQSPWG
jgi:vacuolar-type H+-ATPase subunit H